MQLSDQRHKNNSCLSLYIYHDSFFIFFVKLFIQIFAFHKNVAFSNFSRKIMKIMSKCIFCRDKNFVNKFYRFLETFSNVDFCYMQNSIFVTTLGKVHDPNATFMNIVRLLQVWPLASVPLDGRQGPLQRGPLGGLQVQGPLHRGQLIIELVLENDLKGH